jgi:sulfide:quinone oxidoreductase
MSSNYSFEFAPKTWSLSRTLKVELCLTNPSTPIKCGGAPHNNVFSLRLLAKKGILDKCDVHLYLRSQYILCN